MNGGRVAVWWARSSALLLGTVLLGLVGCGGGTGELSGTVTYKDKPVRVGTVLVFAADGSAQAGVIQDDGTYSVPRIPQGVAKLTVTSLDPKTQKVVMRKKDEKPPPVDNSTWFAIPEKYADHNQSELTTTIKSGPNTFNIELK